MTVELTCPGCGMAATPDRWLGMEGRRVCPVCGCVMPGPDRIDPGTCPGGVVIHVYAVPSGRFLCASGVGPGEDIGETAADDGEFAAILIGELGEDGMCLVAFDGDDGRRMPREAWGQTGPGPVTP